MKRKIQMRFTILLPIVVLMLAACGGGGEGHNPAGAMTKAVAVLHPTEGNKVQGVVSITKTEKGIRIQAGIEGLTPGLHGFHIHEYGDCSSPDATSAGGHFNPDNMPHAAPTAEKRHAGDLGNVEADSNGIARFDMTDSLIGFEGPRSIIGRSIIVHLSRDDFTTQPTGNAGARVACGVIGFAK
jgi:Cu-Zn family superoxide dismutase